MLTLFRSLVSSLVLIPVFANPAAAQSPSPSPTVSPVPGTCQESELQAIADAARDQADVEYREVPEPFTLTASTTPESLARWAAEVRAQRAQIVLLLEGLDAAGIEEAFEGNDLQELRDALRHQIANRDGWLDRALLAYLDRLKTRADRQREYDAMPSIGAPGPPSPPRVPHIRITPASVIVQGIGVDALDPLDVPVNPWRGTPTLTSRWPRVASCVGIVNAIDDGYVAGGWMGNEVVLKGMMIENAKARERYEAELREYERRVDAWETWAPQSGRTQWELDRMAERDAENAAVTIHLTTLLSLLQFRDSTNAETWADVAALLRPPTYAGIAGIPSYVVPFYGNFIEPLGSGFLVTGYDGVSVGLDPAGPFLVRQGSALTAPVSGTGASAGNNAGRGDATRSVSQGPSAARGAAGAGMRRD